MMKQKPPDPGTGKGKLAVIALSTVIALGGLAVTRYASVAQVAKADQLQQLDREILGAYASFGDLAFFKSQDDPDSQRVVRLIESRKAAVDKIVADYKAGRKTPKAALLEIQAVFKGRIPGDRHLTN